VEYSKQQQAYIDNIENIATIYSKLMGTVSFSMGGLHVFGGNPFTDFKEVHYAVLLHLHLLKFSNDN
jgi:hypothetical protein